MEEEAYSTYFGYWPIQILQHLHDEKIFFLPASQRYYYIRLEFIVNNVLYNFYNNNEKT